MIVPINVFIFQYRKRAWRYFFLQPLVWPGFVTICPNSSNNFESNIEWQPLVTIFLRVFISPRILVGVVEWKASKTSWDWWWSWLWTWGHRPAPRPPLQHLIHYRCMMLGRQGWNQIKPPHKISIEKQQGACRYKTLDSKITGNVS